MELNETGQEADPKNPTTEAEPQEPTEAPEEGGKVEENPEQQIARLEKENATLTGKSETLRKKVERLTNPPKEEGAPATTEAKTELTSNELMVVMEAKVPAQDVAELQLLAKAKSLSIAEALKDTTIKIVLDGLKNQRDVANAANTSKGGKPKAALSGKEMFDKAQKDGELPDATEENIDAMFMAQKKG